MMERFPDIEVYLARVTLDDINAWLADVLSAPPLSPAGKGKWKTRGQYQGDSVPVLLVDNAADGFASLWFDSGHTPWHTDQECAQHAAEALQVEVRCSLGAGTLATTQTAFGRCCPAARKKPSNGRTQAVKCKNPRKRGVFSFSTNLSLQRLGAYSIMLTSSACRPRSFLIT